MKEHFIVNYFPAQAEKDPSSLVSAPKVMKSGKKGRVITKDH